ncbi:MAG: hypothetical protein R2941_20375 [Desulfobacterales bacterium]
MRKLDFILKPREKTRKWIKDAMRPCSDVTFREIPDEAGDSATFLSFFLPDESSARNAAGELAKAGVDGCFYWYDNNWHYIRQWEHSKYLRSAKKSVLQLLEKCPDYYSLHLPKSDAPAKVGPFPCR